MRSNYIKTLLYVSILVSATFAQSFTEISGNIEGFLKAANAPYLATGDLVVGENDALVIEPGVEIVFKTGTGLNIQDGAIAAMGQENSPIIFRGNDGEWNGITLTGETRASFNNIRIEKAKVALALENTGADIFSAKIHDSGIGIFAKGASVNLQNSRLEKISGAAVIAEEGSTVSMNHCEIMESNVAYLSGKNSKNNFANVSIQNNNVGLADQGSNSFEVQYLKNEDNAIGISADDVPPLTVTEATKNNKVNMAAGTELLVSMLPSVPQNDFARRFEKPAKIDSAEVQASVKKWALSGNVSTAVGYHLVRTLHDSTDNRYENYFQVPGLFSNYNTYIKLESPDGRTTEFTTSIGSDHWNEWNVHKVNATYTDATRKISLGDTYINAGETYLGGINLFGASYSVDYLKLTNDLPIFRTTVFAGETNRPKLVGQKNPEFYKDYIEDGEGEAQEVVAGGKITWNMHRRFNGTLGFIAGEDYKEDPFFRDGMSSHKNTVDPEISSRTFFAEGNWLFWPGNIELNGQVAIGAADTSDVNTQRAVNSIFSKAGVSVSNFALLRKIMKNENMISYMSREQLLDIFGDNTSMSPSEMKQQLRELVAKAKKAEASYEKSDDNQAHISEWDGNNFAALASMRWGIGNTVLNAHYKYVGSKFYSAGSPDQLSNYRELSASIDQRFGKNWRLSLSYNLNIENAAIGHKANIFGFGEGTTMGLFGSASDEWTKAHDQDDLRALYVHNAAFKNNITLGFFNLALRYKINYRTRHMSTRLQANSNVESGIFDDKWFRPGKKAKTYSVVSGTDTVVVDAEKYKQYYELTKYEYIASDFTEKILKNTVEAELGIRFSSNLLKVGATWTHRTDFSEFENNSLIKDFDFSNRTYGILGYYFHSADYFEQRYPISLTTNFDRFHNQISITPRYKIYSRDKMKEFEWSIDENLEAEVFKNFMDFALNGGFRQEVITRHSEGENEEDADFYSSATIRLHHTKDLYSDYTLGVNYSYRPDAKSEQYKDYYAVFSLNYAF